jgi:hypothetical protein
MRAARTLARPFGRAARTSSGRRIGWTAVRTHAEAISDAEAARMYWA